MPIKIQSDLPAKEILENENIFVMDENRAMHQDIRPLQIAILNIMPVKAGYGAATFACAVQFSFAGGCDFFKCEEPYFQKYTGGSSE